MPRTGRMVPVWAAMWAINTLVAAGTDLDRCGARVQDPP